MAARSQAYLPVQSVSPNEAKELAREMSSNSRSKVRSSTKTLLELSQRQGGGYLLNREQSVYPITSDNYVFQDNAPKGYKPFQISIVDKGQKPEVTLTLLVNPSDIQIGQVFLANNEYTRNGWVTTLWGKQQSTITANAVSAGFFLNAVSTGFTSGAPSVGLTTARRKETIGFVNLLSIISLFKNNGYYFLEDTDERTLFSRRINRINHVMDNVMISYDGSEFLGSFNSFTLDDTGDTPYHMKYNFEYVVSGVRGTTIEGHIRSNGNELGSKVELAIQGANTKLFDVILMSQEELNKDFKVPPLERRKYEAKRKKWLDETNLKEEKTFYDGQTIGSCKEGLANFTNFWDTDFAKNNCISKVGEKRTRITSSFNGRPDHENRIDYRTASGEVRSFSSGTVAEVHPKNPGNPKDHGYVVIRTKGPDGKAIYVKYLHIDTKSIVSPKDPAKSLKIGDHVDAGQIIGIQGTDDGVYPPHTDLEVLKINNPLKISDAARYQRKNATVIPASDYFIYGCNNLRSLDNKDYENLEFKDPVEATKKYRDGFKGTVLPKES